LFVLYGDFTSNSANHVAAFADELIGRGFDCIVAVPSHMETIGSQPQARFLGIEYADLDQLPSYFRDNRAPAVVHAWTTRESVREFCNEVVSRFGSEVVIHLEDNEREILARHLKCKWDQLVEKSSVELAEIVPRSLSHPIHAEEFLRSAQGVTVIVDPLAQFVPSEVPHATIWPAASAAFSARPPHPQLRTRLGITLNDIVLFYHGNVHQANADEVSELYRAVVQLNAQGHPTWLVRTGRDSPEFTQNLDAKTRKHIIEIGFVKRPQDLPEFMRLADFFVQPGEAGSFNDYRFPSKLPEFFALGRPVILPRTNVGLTLTHLQSACVLDKADASSIAAAVIMLRNDPDLTKKLSAGALQFSADRFSWPQSTDRLIAFYHQVTKLGHPNQTDVDAAHALSRAFSDQAVS
jgi:glycosyltransferase involved in cell wall biosynthesis